MKQWIILKRELKLNDKFDYIIEREEAEREIIGLNPSARPNWKKHVVNTYPVHSDNEKYLTAPATEEAKQWEGWGTALKPAHEPIVVARKPISEKNIASNVLRWGTGGINIDGCRIESQDKLARPLNEADNKIYGKYNKFGNPNEPQGRFPANVILECSCESTIHKNSCPCRMLDAQSGEIKTKLPFTKLKETDRGMYGAGLDASGQKYTSQKGLGIKVSGASRFFYCAKASKSERNYGCEELEPQQRDHSRKEGNPGGDNPRNRGVHKVLNNHPTVKPIALMRYLIRLVTPKGGVVLDPFIGSGTTAIACLKENFKFIGIEKDEEYVKIANARIKPFLEQKKLSEASK